MQSSYLPDKSVVNMRSQNKSESTHWTREGKEPDYRFTLANERTFLAWVRTGLALLAGGLLLDQFASELKHREMVLGWPPHGIHHALFPHVRSVLARIEAGHANRPVLHATVVHRFAFVVPPEEASLEIAP